MSRISTEEIRFGRGGHNRAPLEVERRYFELIGQGCSGSDAAVQVGVALSCGSLWFIDAGSVNIVEQTPISSGYLSQDDRIAIADDNRCVCLFTMMFCVSLSRPSSRSSGRRHRSAGGCGGVTHPGRSGMCVTRRSMKESIAA